MDGRFVLLTVVDYVLEKKECFWSISTVDEYVMISVDPFFVYMSIMCCVWRASRSSCWAKSLKLDIKHKLSTLRLFFFVLFIYL